METVALSSKGQFVLPKSIRDLHHWDVGTRFFVIDRGTEVVLKPAIPFEPTVFEPADGQSVYSGKRLSLSDMDKAVAQEAGARK
jgi:AbrB family looped-hinge helix DNA binding protein